MLTFTKAMTASAVLVAGLSTVAVAPAWSSSTSSAGAVRFQSQGGDRDCLDSNWEGDVYSIACNARDYQRWYIEPGLEPGLYRLKNKKTGRYLEGIGTAADQVTTKPSRPKFRNQNWFIENNTIRSATSGKGTVYDVKGSIDVRMTLGSVNPPEFGRWSQLSG